MFSENKYYDKFEVEDIVNKKLTGSYLWMGLGLLITFAIMQYSLYNRNLLIFSFNLARSNMSFLGLLAFVLIMGAVIRYSNATVLKICFALYSVYMGIVLAPFIIVYELSSVYSILLSSAILFIIMASYGYFTNNNLQSYNKYLYFSLIGILVVSLLNLFIFKHGMLELIITIVGLIIFVIYVAVDTQRIKGQIIEAYYYGDREILNKIQILGAFHLYLDFINIFIRLLALFGKKRD